VPGHGQWFWGFFSKVQAPGDVPDCCGNFQMKARKPDMAVGAQKEEGRLRNMRAR